MPEGKRCAACFSFDFDALSLWIGSFKITTQSDLSRGEFGAVGARRILDLLDKYSLKSTWFVPGHTVETYPDLVKEIFDKGHEIGHHNYLHESPLELKTKQQEKSVMQRASRCIEREEA
jgi:peptidoglycan/xylan/chitin deacetylase (PgdA/CDA1 family)